MRTVSLLFAMAACLSAQTFTARLTGTITDPSGAAVPNARITARSTAQNTSRTVTSEASGLYSIPTLLPGNYDVTIEATGFTTQTLKDVRLEINQTATLDAKLGLAQTQTSVEVTADVPLLQSETSSVGTTVENKLLLQFPLPQRDVMGILRTMPGVITSSQVGDARGGRNVFNSTFSVGGGRTSTNEVLLDGAPNTIGDFNGVVIVPPQDSVQEMRVEMNAYSAEFGRSGGGAVNMVTKSGSNQYHGTAFYYHQNNWLNANSFTNNRLNLPRPIVRRHQYGFTLGGPVNIPKLYKGENKTFFFSSYEGRREADPLQGLTSVPTDRERNGDFSQTFAIISGAPQLIQIFDPLTSQLAGATPTRDLFPGNVVPRNRMNSIALRVLQDHPTGNREGIPITGRNNYFFQDRQKYTRDMTGHRVDHNFSDKHRFFGRFNFQENLQFNPGVITRFADTTSVYDRFYNIGIDDTYTLSARMVNNFRASWARFHAQQVPFATLGFDPSSLGLPPYIANSANISFYPNFSFGFTAMGGRAYNNQPRDTWSLQDSIIYSLGRHNLKFGGEWRMYRFYPFQVFDPVGSYSFGSGFTQRNFLAAAQPTQGFGLASFLLGYGNFSFERVEPLTAASHYWAGYIQDDWKVTNNLTLNLGLRWEYETGIFEAHDRLTYFDPTFKTRLRGQNGADVNGAMLFAGGSNPRSLRQVPLSNFGPRIGFAYRVASKTTLRGGYGLFYLPQGLEPTLSTTPFNFTTIADVVAPTGQPLTSLSNPFPNGIPLNAPRVSDGSYRLGIQNNIVLRDTQNTQPYIQQWNFAFGQQIGRSQVIDLTYFGSRGVHLPIPSLELNQMNPNVLPANVAERNQFLNQRVPNPFVGQINTGLFSGATIPQQQLLKPYPQFASPTTANAYGGSLNWFRPPVGDSIYHAATAKYERRFSQGVSVSTHYTWSKLIDNGGGGNGAAFTDPSAFRDIYNPRLERSLSVWDVPHRFILTYSYDLPFGKGRKFMNSANPLVERIVGGWTVFSFHTLESGRPIVVGGPDLSRLAGASPSRVSVVPGVKAALPSETSQNNARNFNPLCNCTQPWFNPAAFSTTPEFVIPNGPRTLPDVRQDWTRNWDLSIDKKTRITEKVNFTLQGRFFNTVNQIFFAGPGVTAVNAANFGSTTGVNSAPRRIEIGGRIVF